MKKLIFDALYSQISKDDIEASQVECDKEAWEQLPENERSSTTSIKEDGDKYYRIVPSDLDKDELIALNIAKQTKMLVSIDKTLSFFKVLVIIGLVLVAIMSIAMFV